MESALATHRVLIADDLAPSGIEILRAEPGLEVDVRPGLSPEELARVVGDYHALLVRGAVRVTGEVLAQARQLRIIGRAGLGVDTIDVPAASRRGIIVANAPGGNATTAAEHAIALLCALVRNIPQATASMKAGKWEKRKFAGHELCGKTLGVIGLGTVGRIVARLGAGLQLRVIAADPFVGAEGAAGAGVPVLPLDEVYARADFLTVHAPLNAETRGLVGAAAFARMRRGVYLVNAARGGIVDEGALLEALQSGHVAGAALDVFATEPPGDHPLLQLPNVIATPHLGASTEEAQEKVSAEVAQQIVAFFRTGEVRNAVNVPAVPAELRLQLSPYLDLARRLGCFVGQLDRGAALEAVEVEVSGELAASLGGAGAVGAAALAGLMRLVDADANEVSARMVAADRGLRVTETTAPACDYAAAVALRLRGAGGARYVKGAVFTIGGIREPRLVQLDEFRIELQPAGSLLVVRAQDRPGVIGAIGSLLGARGVNVARLAVGLHAGRDEAVMLWNVDAPVADGVLAEVRALPHTLSAQVVTVTAAEEPAP